MGAYNMRPSHASHFDVYKLDTSLASNARMRWLLTFNLSIYGLPLFTFKAF